MPAYSDGVSVRGFRKANALVKRLPASSPDWTPRLAPSLAAKGASGTTGAPSAACAK